MKLIQVGVFASVLMMLVSSLSFSEIGNENTGYDVADDEERIIGGSDAKAGRFPYLASLRLGGPNNPTSCGGALIAPQYVLTAGQCLEMDVRGMYVSLGMLQPSGGGSTKAEKIRVTKLFRHPKFNLTEKAYDVAVLKLKAPSKKKIASLPDADGSNNPPGTLATVMGWGLINNETSATTLQTVDLEIISNEECYELSSYDVLKKYLMCAGREWGKDACNGDSGGPLVVGNTVVGIVSSGAENCGSEPGLYTRVTSVLDFIKDILNGGTTGDVTPFLTTPNKNMYTGKPRPIPAA